MHYHVLEPRILLINPKQVRSMGEFTLPPMGLAMISAVLKENHYYVQGLNLDYETKELAQNLHDIIMEHHINIVGIGSLSYGYNEVQEILTIVKTINPNILTILGGGIIKEDSMLLFDSFEHLDIGVVGEGEVTVVELMNSLKTRNDLQTVDGLIYRSDNQSIQTKERALIKNLDVLPFPDFEAFNIDAFFDLQYVNSNYQLYKYNEPKLLPLFSSRSCPFECTFCAHIIGRKYRAFSLDYFFNLLDYVVQKYTINILQVMDELFSVNKERLKEFCRRIKPYNLIWWAQTRVDVITEEDLIMMKDAGCYFVSYGLEHVSPEILKSMKKKIKFEDIERVLDITYKLKLGIQGNIIIGDPQETEETFLEAANWVIKNKKYQANLYPIITYPGTEIYAHAINKGLIPDKIAFIKSKYLFLNLTQMSNDKYHDIVKFSQEVAGFIAIYGSLISIQQKWFHRYLGLMYDLSVTCGHCQQEMTFTNFHINPVLEVFKSIKLCCKHCNGKFDINKNTLRIAIFDGYHFPVLHQKQQEIYMLIDQKMSDIDTEINKFYPSWKSLNITKIYTKDEANSHQTYQPFTFANSEQIDFVYAKENNILFILPFLKNTPTIQNHLEFLYQNGVDTNSILILDPWITKYKKRLINE